MVLRLRNTSHGGFTLIEGVVVVTIVAILAVLALPRFSILIARSRESAAKGHLGSLRSAITIYYSDTEGLFPTDDLTCLTGDRRYLETIPYLYLKGLHDESNAVENNDGGQIDIDDGRWKYWNWPSAGAGVQGHLWVGCTHTDSSNAVWSVY